MEAFLLVLIYFYFIYLFWKYNATRVVSIQLDLDEECLWSGAGETAQWLRAPAALPDH